ncbi:sugar-phosphatase [Lactococcus termiticola]|uniref:Sugar phosphate phosphatase n=1 Tax=Lactococcus termiticola TaxID=2169526 RepID=A0A2R5HI07_9LACT|nr:sugar-phosphatase [Lactococcus termiticola]GBG97075.1 sugar phosphate phosphatase [Lactococcus termiticola]
MIKLVAIDLDGTLLDPDRKIVAEVKEAVAKAKKAGVKIVITTGRPLMGVKDILDELNLNEPGDYVITYNGALVQRADTGEEFIRESLTAEDYLNIEAAARKIGSPLHAITIDGIYTSNRDIGKYTVHEAEMVKMPLHFRQPEEIAGLEIAKVMIVDEAESLDNAIAYLPFEFFERYTMVKSTPYYLEFMNKKASKGNAVLELAEKLFLDKDELMAIGDEENDRSMLEAVGNPVVMENGKEALKKIAKYITKSNAEAGVAHAINTWVL